VDHWLERALIGLLTGVIVLFAIRYLPNPFAVSHVGIPDT
jgi:hypothetical protein